MSRLPVALARVTRDPRAVVTAHESSHADGASCCLFLVDKVDKVDCSL